MKIEGEKYGQVKAAINAFCFRKKNVSLDNFLRALKTGVVRLH